MGGSSSSSKPRDLTPAEFRGLRAPLAGQLQTLLRQGGLPQPEGPLSAPITAGETDVLAMLQQALSGSQLGAAQGALAEQAGGVTNPFATVAGLTQGEAAGLSQLARLGLGGDSTLNRASGTLQQFQNGVFNPFAQVAPLSAAEQAGINQIQQTAFGQSGLQTAGRDQLGRTIAGDFLSPESNPFLQSTIDAALRPIREQFGDATLANRSQFTDAGQFIGPRSSSPFDVADARLQTGLANALGDTASRIAFENFARERQNQLDATAQAEQIAGADLLRQVQGQQVLGLPRELADLALQRQSGAFDTATGQALQAAGMAPGVSGQGFSQALQATQALGLPRELADLGLQRQSAAFEADQARRTEAATALPQIERQQVESIMENLRAQALPRLIEELGIERGLAAFSDQQQSLLALLQLAGQISSPTVANETRQSGGSPFLGALGKAAGTAIGGPVGGAIGGGIAGVIGG